MNSVLWYIGEGYKVRPNKKKNQMNVKIHNPRLGWRQRSEVQLRIFFYFVGNGLISQIIPQKIVLGWQSILTF